MGRLEVKFEDFKRALSTLEEILNREYSVEIRDATIQRFEYTFEALWKFLKVYLKEKEGSEANFPKSVFRDCLSAGILSEEETALALKMVDDRNDTVHTYKESLAEEIFKKIPEYCKLMRKILDRIKEKI